MLSAAILDKMLRLVKKFLRIRSLLIARR